MFYVSRAAAPKGAMFVLSSFCLTRGTEALAIIIRDLTVGTQGSRFVLRPLRLVWMLLRPV